MERSKLSAAVQGVVFEGDLEEEATVHAGAGLLLEVARRSGVVAAADRALPAKKNAKGLTHGQMVETMVLLSALGGGCIDDLEMLPLDRGLAALAGYRMPAA